MKSFRRAFVGFAFMGSVFGFGLFALSSCAYQPHASRSSHSSFGVGSGFGHSGFSTRSFVSTGNSRWGYDPWAGAYYDHTRRAYYDPHLYGYYPVGYRPKFVSGSPHPGGWSRGKTHLSAPSRVRNYNLKNFSDRSSRYQGLGRSWSRNVKSGSSKGFQHKEKSKVIRKSAFGNKLNNGRSTTFSDKSRSQGQSVGSKSISSVGRFSPSDSRGTSSRKSTGFNQNRSVNSGNRGGNSNFSPQRFTQQKQVSPQRFTQQRQVSPQRYSSSSPQRYSSSSSPQRYSSSSSQQRYSSSSNSQKSFSPQRVRSR